MKKVFYFILLFISSCKTREVKYYNHEKWQWKSEVLGWWYYERVYGNPIEVKEIFNSNGHDSLDNFFRKLSAYTIREFDSDGNVIFLKKVYADSTCFIQTFNYDFNGQQSKEYAINKDSRWGFNEKDTAKMTSVLLPNGKFKISKYDASEIEPATHYSLISFLNNGRKVIAEELLPKIIQDTVGDIIIVKGFSDSLEVSSTFISEFDDNNHITTYEYRSAQGDGFIYKYFYSKNYSLDSIIQYEDGKKIDADFYINNEFGYPEKIGDTTFIYEYDERRNWITRTLKTKSETITVLRQIKYAE